jgi:hypothetical protein
MNPVQSQPAPQSRPQEYHAYHDPTGTAKLSTTVVHSLADVMGEDVTDASFVLHDSVDPDALDRLFANVDSDQRQTPGHAAFTINGYQVTVYGTGEIVITPPEPQLSRQPDPRNR